MTGAAAISAMTVPSRRAPVISPAPVLPAPAAAASIGMTDSSRKKLSSDVNSARNVSASGAVTSRGRAGRVPGWACVRVLISVHARSHPGH